VSNAVVVTQHPLSPTSIPLPASPVILPAAAPPPPVSDTQPSDLPSDPSSFSLAANFLQDASEEVPQAPTDVPLTLSPEEAPAAEYSVSLPKPVSVSTGTEENPQLLDDLPADADTALPSEVHSSGSGDIDGNANIPIHTDVSVSLVLEGHGPDSDIDGTADVPIHTDASPSLVPVIQVSDSADIDGNADVPIQIEVSASDSDDEKIEQPPEDLVIVPPSKCSEADVEALQERLRHVEQRFSGTFLVGLYVEYMLTFSRCVDVF
jgi:hypothetical protein